MNGRINGTIKRLVTEKGFGFVTESTGQDFFFHMSNVLGQFASLYEGQDVTFVPTDTPKGPRATEVQPQ